VCTGELVDTGDLSALSATVVEADRTFSWVTGYLERSLTDAVIAKRRKRGDVAPNKNQPMGLRWPVERNHSWLSNFGQLPGTRTAALCIDLLSAPGDRQPSHRQTI
jgi:hypothetical protein